MKTKYKAVSVAMTVISVVWLLVYALTGAEAHYVVIANIWVVGSTIVAAIGEK